MSDNTTLRPSRVVHVSADVLCQTVEGQAVLLNLATERYHSLDEVGSRVWSLLVADGDVEGAIATMLDEYEVDADVLRSDVDALVAALARAGLVHVETC